MTKVVLLMHLSTCSGAVELVPEFEYWTFNMQVLGYKHLCCLCKLFSCCGNKYIFGPSYHADTQLSFKFVSCLSKSTVFQGGGEISIFISMNE